MRLNVLMNDGIFSVDGRTLTVPGCEPLTFEHPVAQVLVFDDVLVVRLGVPYAAEYGENIFGVARATGRIVWQAPRVGTRYANSPYVNLNRVGDSVATGKSEGLELELDPASGRILRQQFRRF